jgi:hypothetical protein
MLIKAWQMHDPRRFDQPFYCEVHYIPILDEVEIYCGGTVPKCEKVKGEGESGARDVN